MNKPEWLTLERVMKEKLPKSPSVVTLKKWKVTDNWDQHADTLDGISDNAMDKEIIQQRAELIKKQADIGTELIDLGMGYLKEHGIDTSADAIRAIAKGTELQEKQLGWAIVFTELANASDDELEKRMKKLMTDEVIIEGTVKDAPTDESAPETERDE
jgi:hypothetical protein